MKNYSMDILKIDGSFGEGGGQIIRTAVTLSCITKKPIKIENIRRKRKNPGLRPQHLTGIEILGNICNAKMSGLKVGSTEVEFIPGEMEDKILSEDIGTAGSISLILSVLIPAVSFCKKNLEISIRGGTDVAWSPTAEYTKCVLNDAYSRMGINFSMEIKKRGYYPKGGGIINAKISPCKKLKPIILDKRNTKQIELSCSFSKIPKEDITSNVEKIISNLEEDEFKIKSSINNEDAVDKGSTILLMSKDSQSIIGIDSLYERKIQSFKPEIHKEFSNSQMSVDEHLSDMLVVPASMTNEMSVFKVNKISSHLETNLYVTSKLTGCKYGIGKLDNGFEVRIVGNSDSSI